MKVQYTTANGRMVFDLDVKDHKDAFTQLNMVQEVFEETTCGKCNSDQIKFRHRQTQKDKKTYDYYEMICEKCRARLSYGCHQEGGTLFPKRKDEDGNYDKQSRGWVKWVPNNE